MNRAADRVMKPLLNRGAPLLRKFSPHLGIGGGVSRARLVAGLLCLLLVLAAPFFVDSRTASAYVGVIPATGGEGVEVGSSAPLTGPFITETAPEDIGEGDIAFQVPPGFEFDTTRYVTVTAANTGDCVQEEPPPEPETGEVQDQYATEGPETTERPENRPLLLNGSDSQTVAPSKSRITVGITQSSSGECTASLEWSGIMVKATEAGSGDITKVTSGSAVSGIVDGVTDLGSLSAPVPEEPPAEPEPSAPVDELDEPEAGEKITDTPNAEDQYTGDPEETTSEEDSQDDQGETITSEMAPEQTTAPDSDDSDLSDDPESSNSVAPDETTTQPTEEQLEKTTPLTTVPEEATEVAPEETTEDPVSEEITVVEQDGKDDSGVTMTVDSQNTVSFGEDLSFAGTDSGSAVTSFREGSTGAYYVKDGGLSRYAAVVTVESSEPWVGSVSATDSGTAGMGVTEDSFRWRLGDMSDLDTARGGTPFSTAPDSTVFDTASYCEYGSTGQEGLCTYNFDYSLRVLGSDSLGTFSSVVTYKVSPL